jgi:hypothetical protein
MSPIALEGDTLNSFNADTVDQHNVTRSLDAASVLSATAVPDASVAHTLFDLSAQASSHLLVFGASQMQQSNASSSSQSQPIVVDMAALQASNLLHLAICNSAFLLRWNVKLLRYLVQHKRDAMDMAGKVQLWIRQYHI